MNKLLILFLAAFFALLAHHALRGASEQAEAQDEVIKTGERVYKAQCMPCHTTEGKSPIKSMNLADEDWHHAKTQEEIESVVAKGIKGTAMMPFETKLSKDEIKAVAKYVLTFGKSEK